MTKKSFSVHLLVVEGITEAWEVVGETGEDYSVRIYSNAYNFNLDVNGLEIIFGAMVQLRKSDNIEELISL